MQIDEEDEFSRYLRLRWTRGDADRYVRPDRERYVRPAHLPPPYRKSAASAGQAGASARPLWWLNDAEISQIRCEIASLRLELALLRFGSRTKALHHSNFQPRVPAGSSDGGQWTDGGGGTGGGVTSERVRVAQANKEILDSDGRPYYQSGGHHEMAKGIYKKWNLRPETRRVFDEGTTGRIPRGIIRTTPDGAPIGHFWNGPGGAHGRYNEAIDQLGNRFLEKHRISPEQMTPDHARSLLKEIRESPDSRIRDYNNALRMLRRLYRLRTGRGTE